VKRQKPAGQFELPTTVLEHVTRWGFGAVAVLLVILALVMTAVAIGETIYALVTWQNFNQTVLRGVGYVVIAIAVFEVAKYLVEEEVMRGREMRAPAEARRSLTKFVATISIAVFLEGLVTVFRVSHESVADLVYPVLLLLTAILLILGLGVFQRLSVAVEGRVDTEEEAEAS
jgi:hypothetical protein